jgi:hypothetical protein
VTRTQWGRLDPVRIQELVRLEGSEPEGGQYPIRISRRSAPVRCIVWEPGACG